MEIDCFFTTISSWNGRFLIDYRQRLYLFLFLYCFFLVCVDIFERLLSILEDLLVLFMDFLYIDFLWFFLWILIRYFCMFNPCDWFSILGLVQYFLNCQYFGLDLLFLAIGPFNSRLQNYTQLIFNPLFTLHNYLKL